MRDEDINVPVTDEDGVVDQARLVDRIVAELQILAMCTPRLPVNQLTRLVHAGLALEPFDVWTNTRNACNVDEYRRSMAKLRAEGLVFDEGTRLGPDGRQHVVRHAIKGVDGRPLQFGE